MPPFPPPPPNHPAGPSSVAYRLPPIDHHPARLSPYPATTSYTRAPLSHDRVDVPRSADGVDAMQQQSSPSADSTAMRLPPLGRASFEPHRSTSSFVPGPTGSDSPMSAHADRPGRPSPFAATSYRNDGDCSHPPPVPAHVAHGKGIGDGGSSRHHDAPAGPMRSAHEAEARQPPKAPRESSASTDGVPEAPGEVDELDSPPFMSEAPSSSGLSPPAHSLPARPADSAAPNAPNRGRSQEGTIPELSSGQAQAKRKRKRTDFPETELAARFTSKRLVARSAPAPGAHEKGRKGAPKACDSCVRDCLSLIVEEQILKRSRPRNSASRN